MSLLSLFFILTLKHYNNTDDTTWVGQCGYNDYDDTIKLAIILWYYENAAINLITMNNDKICSFVSCVLLSFYSSFSKQTPTLILTLTHMHNMPRIENRQ